MLFIKSKIYMQAMKDRLLSDERGVIGELFLIIGMVLLVVVILATTVPTVQSFVGNSLSSAQKAITNIFGSGL